METARQECPAFKTAATPAAMVRSARSRPAASVSRVSAHKGTPVTARGALIIISLHKEFVAKAIEMDNSISVLHSWYVRAPETLW